MKGSFGIALLVALLAALVGHLIGQVLPWPSAQTSLTMGLPSPVSVDLGIITLVFGFTIRLSLAGAVGLVAGFLYMLRRH